jgi:IS30 family transposase
MAIIQKLTPLKPFVHSITLDQGSEFARYKWLKACLDADIYFCDPGSPHQKGSIENRNGVLRTVFPRNYTIAELSDKNLEQIVQNINARPMKCLAYNTPQHAFDQYSFVV